LADAAVLDLLKSKVVPVAIDHWYWVRRSDAEGDFYRKVVGQGPRRGQPKAAQGIYTINPDGKLLGYSNRTDPGAGAGLKQQLQEALAKFENVPAPELGASTGPG